VKKSAKIIISILIVSILITISSLKIFKVNNNSKINTILESSSYAYLSYEAKNYIKDIYEKTGEVILTEKNKEVNKPYLNPQYAAYLALSDNEKKQIDLIPTAYITSYNSNPINYNSDPLPSSYDLRNVNGNSYITPLKNQGSLGICWAISTIENAETFVMKTTNTPYNANSQIFSARQLDYATSTDGMYYMVNNNTSKTIFDNYYNGFRTLGGGGNFYMSDFVLANGLSLTDESILPWDELSTLYTPSSILNNDNSKYEINSSIELPLIDADTPTTTQVTNFTTAVKNYVLTYGGPFIGTISPQSTCGFRNTNGDVVLKTDDCINDNGSLGHALQLIGWDDNYTYSYCDDGTTHRSVTNGSCSSGTLVNGTGAWIIRNSWGSNTIYKYFYLTYDSTRVSTSFITSLSKMEGRNWDNNYHFNPFDGGLGVSTIQSKEFTNTVIGTEKVQKVKFYAAGENGNYTLSITSKSNNYNDIMNVTIPEAGIYTFDLTSKNIQITDHDFTVNITSTNSTYLIYDSISVFTSNVDKTPKIKTLIASETHESTEVPSVTNPIYVKDDTSFSLEHLTKNIPANANITYKIINSNNEDYTSYFIPDNKYNINSLNGYTISYPAFNLTETQNNPICGVTFTLEVIYNGTIMETFPIKRICNNKTTSSTIKFHKNDGSNLYTSVLKTDLTTINLLNADGTQKEDIGDLTIFFTKNKYIKSWNTSSDGTGISYTNNNLEIYHDLDLYAIWDSPHLYNINYNLGSTINTTQNYLNNVTIYEIPADNQDLINHQNNNEAFINYSYNDKIYYEGEQYDTLVPNKNPYNKNETATLTSNWSNTYKTITFDSNTGTGTMKSINVIPNKDVRIKYNSFTKEGLSFKYWNTKADNTGTKYNDGDLINISDNLTLYAQWSSTSYTITFNSNDGTNTTTSQIIYEDNTKLNKNTFTRTGYTFTGWNTSSDGTGTAYSNEEAISISSNLTLYAIWSINTYTITFNANNGESNTLTQTATYNESVKLNKNTFTKANYAFSKWNTKSDGTGDSYTDEQLITLTSNLTLYAIWSANEYQISFYANNGTNTLLNQLVAYNTSTKLNKNTFVFDNHTFSKWNTKSDGTGDSYTDEQIVSLTSDLTLYAIWTLNPSYTIKTYTHDDTLNIIEGILPNTSVSDYANNIILSTGFTMEIINNSSNNYIGTGSKIKIYNNKVLIKTYTNIIRGDVNGDGLITSADYIKIKKHIMNTELILDSAIYRSADVNKDNKITSSDYIKIKKHIMNGEVL
jgi:uncharacterized repeat protein (TIGR02543 family)